MATHSESNNFLYFMIGVIIVAVGILSYIYFAGANDTVGDRVVNPVERTIERNTTIMTPAPDRPDTDRTEFNVDTPDGGVSGSVTNQD